MGKTWQQYPGAVKRSHLYGAILRQDDATQTGHAHTCTLGRAVMSQSHSAWPYLCMFVNLRHIRQMSPVRANSDTEFHTFFHLDKYHNEAAGDVLFLQLCVFFLLLFPRLCVYIYGQIFAPHGKYWDFHLTSLRISCVCVCVCVRLRRRSCDHTPCVYTAGCHGH